MSTRRVLLRAAGLAGVVGLAGCTAISNDGSAPLTDGGDGPGSGGPVDGPGGSAPSEREHPPDATHRATITASDDAPDLPVVPQVSLADPYVTQGSPPVVRITVENPTDEPVVIGEYRAVVFQYVYSEGDRYVWLPHSERSTEGAPDRTTPDYEVEGDGCWQLDGHPAVTQEYGTVEIPAGGALTAFVGLYSLPDATDCVPLGEHRFETSYAYLPDGIGGDDSQHEQWGFTLAVEEL